MLKSISIAIVAFVAGAGLSALVLGKDGASARDRLSAAPQTINTYELTMKAGTSLPVEQFDAY